MRAFVVCKLTLAAGANIPASEFDFAIFGPIFCGTVAGCGGAFLPLNKGLDPIKENGLAPPMFSAFIGALFFHLFVNLAADDIVDGVKKAKVAVATWFILYGYYTAGIFGAAHVKKDTKKTKEAAIKKEK